MAGAGSRFAVAGYSDPKPLIQVHVVPMIKVVIEKSYAVRDHKFIFICQAAHVSKYGYMKSLTHGRQVVKSLNRRAKLKGLRAPSMQLNTSLITKSSYDCE